MALTEQNILYYSDNLDMLRRHVGEESGSKSDAQPTAFEDHWGPDDERQQLYLTKSAYHSGRVPSTAGALVGRR